MLLADGHPRTEAHPTTLVSEQMDCSDDFPAAGGHPIKGDVALAPLLHPCPDAESVGPSISTGDSVSLDDQRVDPPFDTHLPIDITPLALPPEWLDVFHALEAIPRRHGLHKKSTTPPIIPECVSFSDCIDRSREYAIKVDIGAIKSTARTLFADHKGVDEDIMSRHISMIKEKGLGQALQHFSLIHS